MTPTPQELKPCPFCGIKLVRASEYGPVNFVHPDWVHSKCRLACMQIEEDEVPLWNTRCSAEPVDGECNHPIMWRCEYCEKRKPVDAGELDAAIEYLSKYENGWSGPYGCAVEMVYHAAKAHRASLSNVTCVHHAGVKSESTNIQDGQCKSGDVSPTQAKGEV